MTNKQKEILKRAAQNVPAPLQELLKEEEAVLGTGRYGTTKVVDAYGDITYYYRKAEITKEDTRVWLISGPGFHPVEEAPSLKEAVRTVDIARRIRTSKSKIQGAVKWFDNAKGYGFVTTDVGPVFVHYSAIEADGFRTLTEGDRVELEITEGPKGYHATYIQVIDQGEDK